MGLHEGVILIFCCWCWIRTLSLALEGLCWVTILVGWLLVVVGVLGQGHSTGVARPFLPSLFMASTTYWVSSLLPPFVRRFAVFHLYSSNLYFPL